MITNIAALLLAAGLTAVSVENFDVIEQAARDVAQQLENHNHETDTAISMLLGE